MVRSRIAANSDNPAWAKLEARWAAILAEAEATMAARVAGRPGVSWKVAAAFEAMRLAPTVHARQVVETVAAMFLMRETEGRRFRSDRAFRTQVVRRVRGLTEGNATEYRDFATNKLRRTYSELGPRATAVMADWLIEAFGVAGQHIARREREEREEKARERQSLAADLEGLQ